MRPSVIVVVALVIIIALLYGPFSRARRARDKRRAAEERKRKEFSRRFRCGTPLLGAERLRQEIQNRDKNRQRNVS